MSAGAQARPERELADRRAERNRLLTETGPGTIMGDLMRRYWMPALLADELAEPDEPPGLEWVLVPQERRYITKRVQECNYLQALEGGIDSSHVGFLHEGSLKTDPLFMGPSKGNIYTAHDRSPYFEVEEYDSGLLIA